MDGFPTLRSNRRYERRNPLALRAEDGSSLIEVVVSAMLVVLIAMGAFGAIDAATRSSAEERHRAQAHALAEQDQARLRSLQISALSNLEETREVTVENNRYTVSSRGDFITADADTTSCGGDASADYIRITSNVTWPSIGSRPPIVVQSIVAPPNGSISADHGALAITVLDGNSDPVSGVIVSGGGAGMFSGTTDENGCVMFGNLPEGDYTLEASGVASNLVDRDGNPPGSSITSVVGGSTNTVTLQYAEPGSAAVSFEMRRDDGTLVPAGARSVVAFNTGMTQARAFPAPGNEAAETITAEPLFPFTSPVTFYAGRCEENNPNPEGTGSSPYAAALVSRTVPPGGAANPGTVQLPALHVTALYRYWGGWWTGWVTVPVGNAQVTVTDDLCPGDALASEAVTDAAGKASNIGVPWGRYDICVEIAGYRERVTGVEVKDLSSTGTRETVTFDSGNGLTQGSCP